MFGFLTNRKKKRISATIPELENPQYIPDNLYREFLDAIDPPFFASLQRKERTYYSLKDKIRLSGRDFFAQVTKFAETGEPPVECFLICENRLTNDGLVVNYLDEKGDVQIRFISDKFLCLTFGEFLIEKEKLYES